VFCIGGVLLEEDTRVETANDIPFFITLFQKWGLHSNPHPSSKDQPSSPKSAIERKKSPTKKLNKSLEQGLNLSGS